MVHRRHRPKRPSLAQKWELSEAIAAAYNWTPDVIAALDLDGLELWGAAAIHRLNDRVEVWNATLRLLAR